MAYYQEVRYCIVPNPSLLGDGICNNFDKYNTAGCNFDGGDCLKFNQNYPSASCKAPYPFLLEDQKCDGPEYNNPECNFDGGACVDFNRKYPNCTADKPALVGNGKCEGLYNTTECNYDGLDCLDWWGQHPNCTVDEPGWITDSFCDAEYNTVECGFDGGDCDEFNKFMVRHPTCDAVRNDPGRFGNAYCVGKFNLEECAYDNGACDTFNLNYENCTVERPAWVGDGNCDTGLYNTSECHFDGGDCTEYNKFLLSFPNCDVEGPFRIGDGKCNHGRYNSKECNYDNGDCNEWNAKYQNCWIDDVLLFGNGRCDGLPYNTEECDYDGGDCLPMKDFNATYPGCEVSNRTKLGDGVCDEAPYNSSECGYDNGDCGTVFKKYPDCDIVDDFRDGLCDGRYNSPECGFDGGDCTQFNIEYPNCTANQPWRVGDGICSMEYNKPECGMDGGDCKEVNAFLESHPSCPMLYYQARDIGNDICDVEYNLPECSWDNGDCVKFNTDYPKCLVDNPSKINDTTCDGHLNIAECNYDEDDCKEFNKKYPSCKGVDLQELGDSICQHNSEGCNFDDGDCDFFNRNYPDCDVDKPYLVGDGYCQEEYNTQECKNDGGDCSSILDGRVLYLDGKLVGLEKYLQNTRTYSILQTVSSIISLIASIAIIWIISRSFRQLSVPFHRLLLGLCVADICSSFAQTFSTLPAPESFDIVWNANGTKESCQVQGFFIFLGSIAAPLYNCSLCIYYYIVVTYKGKGVDTYIEKNIEFYLHAIPIAVTLIGATTILSMDAFNPNMTYCFIGADPTCEGIGCEKGNRDAKVLFGVFSGGPYIIFPFVIITTMALMYKAVRAQEKKMQKFGAHSFIAKINRASLVSSPEGTVSTGTMSSNQTNTSGRSLRRFFMKMRSKLSATSSLGSFSTKSSPPQPVSVRTVSVRGGGVRAGGVRAGSVRAGSVRTNGRSNNVGWQKRAILHRALSYSVAFLLTYLFPIIISIRTLNGTESGQVLSILARIFFPLQGFFNFVVFIFPKVLYIKSKHSHDKTITTWFRAFIKAVKSKGTPIRRSAVRIRSNNPGLSLSLSLVRVYSRTSKKLSATLIGMRDSFFTRAATSMRMRSAVPVPPEEHVEGTSLRNSTKYDGGNEGTTLVHVQGGGDEEEKGSLGFLSSSMPSVGTGSSSFNSRISETPSKGLPSVGTGSSSFTSRISETPSTGLELEMMSGDQESETLLSKDTELEMKTDNENELLQDEEFGSKMVTRNNTTTSNNRNNTTTNTIPTSTFERKSIIRGVDSGTGKGRSDRTNGRSITFAPDVIAKELHSADDILEEDSP